MMFAWCLLVVCLLGMALACEDGFLHHGSSCYLIPKQDATWPEAKVFCQAIGADLAMIETADEENFLAAQVRINKPSYPHKSFWIDGSDYKEEGVWIWTRSRERIELTFWGPGEPNNDNAPGDVENCLSLFDEKDFTWDDRWCHDRIHFICEMPNTDIPVVG